MPPYDHFGNHPWWSVFGWLVPVLIVAMLVGAAVWVVARATKERTPSLPPAGWLPPQPATPDPALEHARLRYARGEITRDEFLRLWSDLGGTTGNAPPVVAPPSATPPDGEPAPAATPPAETAPPGEANPGA